MIKFPSTNTFFSWITGYGWDRSCAVYVINSSLLIKPFLAVTHVIIADTRMKKDSAAFLFFFEDISFASCRLIEDFSKKFAVKIVAYI